MIKFIDLCLHLKESHMAKDGLSEIILNQLRSCIKIHCAIFSIGLHQYKNICQQTAIGSLEKIIKYYIRSSEERVKSAKGQLDKIILDVDDLENIETPESVLMAAVSAEDSKDRSDRELLTPWLMFLWDAYRTVLDIIRNNSRLERLYQETTLHGLMSFITESVSVLMIALYSFPVLCEV